MPVAISADGVPPVTRRSDHRASLPPCTKAVRGRQERGSTAGTPSARCKCHSGAIGCGMADDRAPNMGLAEHLLWTVVLGAGLAVAPLLASALSAPMPGWAHAIARGELLIVSVGLAGTGVGNAAMMPVEGQGLRLLRAGTVVVGTIFCVVTSLLYASMLASASEGTLARSTAERQSHALFVISALIAVAGSGLLWSVGYSRSQDR